MTWRVYLMEVASGLVGPEIQIPSFSWTRTIGDSSMQTTADTSATQKGTGSASMSGLTLPWTAVPASTSAGRNALLMPGRMGVVACWDGQPITWGIIGDRQDTWTDTSFPVNGVMSLLAGRIAIPNSWAADMNKKATHNGKITGRAYVDFVIQALQWAMAKPGGALPITMPDMVAGSLTEGVKSWDLSGRKCDTVLTTIANYDNGPDIDFRPYWVDDRHIGLRLTTGDPWVGQDVEHEWHVHAGGGTVEQLAQTVSAGSMASRVYAVGAGQDAGTLIRVAEDTTLTSQGWPLTEVVVTDSDESDPTRLAAYAQTYLRTHRAPLAQWTGVVHAGDAVPLGQFWPGEMTVLHVADYPSIPDGTYRVRLMEMSGDQTDTVTLKWDVMEATY